MRIDDSGTTVVLWGELEPRPGIADELRAGIERLVPAGHRFLIVDDGELGWDAVGDRTALPFVERHGQHWGSPADDQHAISELERMRESGADFIAFAGSALWWLDHYSGFSRYLCDHFPWSIFEDDLAIPILVVFDLRHLTPIRHPEAWARPGQRLQMMKRLVPERALTQKYREAVQMLTSERGTAHLGDYLEFGVYVGSSLACMHRVLLEFACDHVRLFGFDSFEGLPSEASGEDDGIWEVGAFRSNQATARRFLTERAVDWSRLFLIEGWFSDTLNQAAIGRLGITKASIIMIDCDLHSSAIEALRFSGPLIQDEAVIVFDDWNTGDLAERNLGERRAFDQFMAEQPWLDVRDFGSYHPNAATFHVIRKS